MKQFKNRIKAKYNAKFKAKNKTKSRMVIFISVIISVLVFLFNGAFTKAYTNPSELLANLTFIKNITAKFNNIDKTPHSISNFSEAKKLAKNIFSDNPYTFYCHCRYDKHGNIDLQSCGYQIQQDKRRANHIEWEHIMPAHHFGHSLECWRNPVCQKKNGEFYKGRKCCQDTDPHFNRMETDLHNLVPEIGELNQCRSNFRFGILPHIANGQFGTCYFKIDTEQRAVEPRAEIRGIIARTYLYMADTYNIHLSDSQKKLFQAWNNQFPPSEWEITWDNRINALQGNHNAYIRHYRSLKNY